MLPLLEKGSCPMRLTVIATIALALMSPITWADDWQLQSQSDDISVYTSDIPGQSLRAFRGVTVVNKPLNKTIAFLSDAASMPQWFFHMKSAKDVTLPGSNAEYRYLVIAGIWPVKDRDVFVEVSRRNQTDGSVLIVAQSETGKYPQQNCCVRITEMQSSWLAVPVDDTHTEVTLTTKSDPGGMLPLWVANLVATDMPRETLLALREKLK
jgi:hypothetical protein